MSCLRNSGMLLLAAALVATGCNRPPQVSPDNRRIIKTLRTAVFTKDTKWLEDNAKLIDEEHTASHLSDAEYAALKTIVDRAQAGDWKSAQAEVTKLVQTQTPTAEDLERVKSRKPEH